MINNSESEILASENRSIKEKNSELWIDIIKILACVLVVFGHLIQSFVKDQILQDSIFWQRFDTALYFFHVQLFFICSGYLFQKYSHIGNYKEYGQFIFKKIRLLIIPYFVFSIITWLLKYIFSGAVNNQEERLLHVLFMAPLSPYWYLYALFLMMLISPLVSVFFRKWWSGVAGLIIGMLLVYVSYSLIHDVCYPVDIFLRKYVWFVIGMFIASTKVTDFFKDIKGQALRYVLIVFGIFLLLFAGYFLKNVLLGNIKFNYYQYVTGYVICTSIVIFVLGIWGPYYSCKYMKKLALYVMPVFLMHTICASCTRILLKKAGIYGVQVHVILGMIASIAGPIIIYELWIRVLRIIKNKYIDI